MRVQALGHPQLAAESEERRYGYRNGDINRPRDKTSTEQLFFVFHRGLEKYGHRHYLELEAGCDYSIQNMTAAKI